MSETPCVDGCGQDAATIERLCVVMHDAYEAAAIEAGWETQKPSRKPWMDVPEANKATMRVAVRALLDALSPQNHPRSAVDAPEAPGQPGRGEDAAGGDSEVVDLLAGLQQSIEDAKARRLGR